MIRVYGESLALLTDLYQLTMAYGYWKRGMETKEAVFHLFFRKGPFGGNFAIAAGLEQAVAFIEAFRYEESDLAYLASLKGSAGSPLFEEGFIEYLRSFRFTCELDAVEEGTAVMPYEPIVRVQGPIIQAQLLESPLLNMINFQTLIATQAARICYAAKPDPVVEFGMRRAQGIDGALSASRAAFIGGCSSTSHLLAGKVFGIPVKGTQAHSWVMAFDDEEEAFRAFGEVMPENCVFLVDTYDSIEGTKRAIRVILEMKKRGQHALGVRLDSGDLTDLSVEIRKLLDAAGLQDVLIMASNELDEYLIADLKAQGSQVRVWGVGTHLVTAKGQPALDGVYKLSAVRNRGEEWEYKIKISEKMAKMTDPGILQVKRYYSEEGNRVDMIYDIEKPPKGPPELVLVGDPATHVQMDASWKERDLLIPIVREGRRVCALPTLEEIQARSLEEQARFPAAMRRLFNPTPYPVGYEGGLFERKCALVKKIVQRSGQ